MLQNEIVAAQRGHRRAGVISGFDFIGPVADPLQLAIGAKNERLRPDFDAELLRQLVFAGALVKVNRKVQFIAFGEFFDARAQTVARNADDFQVI